MPPIPDVRIDWRGDGFSAITNDSFVTDTSGWSTAAGIQSAATSITRTTGDGVLGGVTTNTCAEVVTTGTNGSGVKYVLSGTFTSGRPYRFSVWLKSVSGTTSAKILIGSLGTGGDRASSTMTITTSWVRYSVDWTPSGSRSDVQVNVTNNAASVMTARVCLAEVFEQVDDIGAYGRNEVEAATWTRGANYDGTAESPGTCSIRVQNINGVYSPDNGSGSLTGLLTTGRPVMVRAVNAGLVYGCFAGTMRRLVLDGVGRMGTIMGEDRLYDLSRHETSITYSSTTSIASFRGAILDDVGWTSSQRDLATGSPEGHVPVTGADQQAALDLLVELNAATGTVHYVRPHPSPSVGWVYTTLDRTEFQTAASVETWDDNTSPGITGLDGWDVTDEAVINSQRVNVTARMAVASDTVWTHDSLPFTVPASTTVTLWADLGDPTTNQVLVSTATNAPTITLTAFSRSAKIVITTGGTASTVSALYITGQAAPVASEGSEQSTTGAADKAGPDVSSEYIEKRATAKGLADYVIQRYGSEKPRPTLGRTNAGASQVTRDIGDVVTVNYGRLSVSGKRLQIRALTTTVQTSALVWLTDYQQEVAMADTELFTVGGSASEGVGGTGILAY